MNINTRDMSFVNFNGQEMNWVKFNGLVVYEPWKILTKSGVPPLTIKSSGADLIDYKMYGQCVQNGVPSPSNPIEIKSVGVYDETTDKYKIPVKVSNDNEETITNIYLKEPLRKLGDYADYIDFENQKVVRNIEKRSCSELEWYQHASYKYVYVFNSARTKAGVNPMSEVFDSTTYQPADSIKNMAKDFCIKAHATSSATYVSDSVHTTEDEFVEFIKDKTIYYVLKTPEEETIELPSIATIKGEVTILTITDTQPSDLEIVYEGK